MGSHCVTCHPAEVHYPSRNWYSIKRPRRDARLRSPSWLVIYRIPRWYTRLETVTHPRTNRARRALTSFMRRTPPTTRPLYATPPTIIIVVRPTIRPHRRSSWMRHIAAGEVALSVCLSVVHNREPYRTDEPIATLSGLCTRGVLTPKLANHVL